MKLERFLFNLTTALILATAIAGCDLLAFGHPVARIVGAALLVFSAVMLIGMIVNG